jgi:uncharacterized protein YndB with AHSA1/START domain
MSTATRSRHLAAPPKEVWRTVGDPHQLARWWPKVLRVEGVADGRFTEVLQTEKGRDVRADFVVLETRRAELWRISQEVEGTPFEGILEGAETEIALQPVGEDGTLITLTLRRRLKGVARFGGFLMRRATTRQVDLALDNLEGIHGARP